MQETINGTENQELKVEESAKAVSAKAVSAETALEKNETLTKVIYALYLVGVFAFFLSIIAVIINHVKAADVKGTFLQSHFKYQMRTFYFGLLYGVIGFVTAAFIVGFFILVANAIWMLYRFIKGFIRLNDQKEMY